VLIAPPVLVMAEAPATPDTAPSPPSPLPPVPLELPARPAAGG